jgi:hypothetical protein
MKSYVTAEKKEDCREQHDNIRLSVKDFALPTKYMQLMILTIEIGIIAT